MAKKIVSAYDAGEKEAIEHLTKLFEAAKFEIQREMNLGDRPRYDLVVGREELGLYRRYAIELALTRNAQELPPKYERLIRDSRKQQFYDEYWFVSNLSMPESPRLRLSSGGIVRAFTIKEVERMLGRLTPKRGSGKARTKIGKALEANEQAIIIAIEALKLQIEDKIAKLRDERPNDPAAITRKDSEIAEFEAMNAELDRIKVAVQKFKKNEAPEKEVVKSVTTFKESVSQWWSGNRDKIYTSTTNSAIFIGATGVLHAFNADSAAALAIVGGFIGGETIGKVLKAIPKDVLKHKG